jgi:hypothetical protein
MIELHNQFGAIDLAKIAEQTDAIIELSPDAQSALSILIDSAKAREAADNRKLAAIKRSALATSAELAASQAFADASMPIPFSTAKAQAAKGSPLNAAEINALREQHDLRCRQYLEDKARRVASGTSDADAVSTLDENGRWVHVAALVPSKAHAKTKGPASFKLALDKCELELIDARAELNAATNAARRASLIEADALQDFQALQTRPTQDDILQDAAKRSLEQRRANVEAGKPPGGIVKSSVNVNSPIDLMASQRPRNAGPLRSNVVRRNVGA